MALVIPGQEAPFQRGRFTCRGHSYTDRGRRHFSWVLGTDKGCVTLDVGEVTGAEHCDVVAADGTRWMAFGLAWHLPAADGVPGCIYLDSMTCSGDVSFLWAARAVEHAGSEESVWAELEHWHKARVEAA